MYNAMYKLGRCILPDREVPIGPTQCARAHAANEARARRTRVKLNVPTLGNTHRAAMGRPTTMA